MTPYVFIVEKFSEKNYLAMTTFYKFYENNYAIYVKIGLKLFQFWNNLVSLKN